MADTIKTLAAAHKKLQNVHNHLVADFEALVLLLIEKRIVDTADLQQRFTSQQAKLDGILAKRRAKQKRGGSKPKK